MAMVCGSEDMDAQQPDSTVREGCSNVNGCTGNGCQQQQHSQPQGSFGSWARRQQTAACSQPTDDASVMGTCRKCKQRPAVLHIRQQEPYCYECLEAGVQQKVRTATKTQGLILPGDHVLVAVSGGAASLALLSCIVEMRSTNTSRPERGKVPFQLTAMHIDSSAAVGTPFDKVAKRIQQLRAAVAVTGYEGSLLVLPLAAVFADEQQLQQQLHSPVIQQLREQMDKLHLTAAQQLSTVQQQGTLEPATAACDDATHLSAHHDQLFQLLSNVDDVTGVEDLIAHLQERLLVRAAASLNCNRLLLGECASRVASKIIADAAKGRGYSLPADIQLLDARSLPSGGPAVVHPIRDVTYRELEALCAFKGISWSDRAPGTQLIEHQRQGPACSSTKGSMKAKSGALSINSLAERFIDDMQSSVPGSIYTILRTAAHLQPFKFNDISAVPEAANAVLPPAMRAERAKHLQQQQQEASSGSCDTGAPVAGSGLQHQLCSVCRAPLPVVETVSQFEGSPAAADPAAVTAAAAAEARLVLAGLSGDHSKQLCYSCNRQMLFRLHGSAVKSNGGADSTLEIRMQRLKQLLPPGMLIDEA